VNTLHSNRGTNRLSGCKSVLLGAAAAAAALLGSSAVRPCLAEPVAIDLSSGNATASIEQASSAGVEDWTINGVNQLNQEWFWYHTTGMTGQSSIDALGLPTITPIGTTGTELVYGSGTSLQITVTYSLTGGTPSSSTSDLTDSIEIDNNSGKSMTLDFFEYANFNLGGLTTNQDVSISKSATATVTGNGLQAQTVVSPDPNEYEANIYPTLLDAISSTSSTPTLNSALDTAGPGDTEFGYEWQLTLPMCGSAVITGDTVITGTEEVVPEPVGTPMAMLALGALMLARPRRRSEA
jgi:hypothetical protein